MNKLINPFASPTFGSVAIPVSYLPAEMQSKVMAMSMTSAQLAEMLEKAAKFDQVAKENEHLKRQNKELSEDYLGLIGRIDELEDEIEELQFDLVPSFPEDFDHVMSEQDDDDIQDTIIDFTMSDVDEGDTLISIKDDTLVVHFIENGVVHTMVATEFFHHVNTDGVVEGHQCCGDDDECLLF